MPEDLGEMFADSAYRGNHFRDTVLAKGGIASIVATGMWGCDEAEMLRKLHKGTNRFIASAVRSRRSSGHGSDVTACAECYGAASPKPPFKSFSPPSPKTSSAR